MKIAFISTHTIGYHTYKPLIEEASRRGHEVVFSSDKNEVADVGIYSDDNPTRGNQEITIIMPNGIDCDHVDRPNYVPVFESQA